MIPANDNFRSAPRSALPWGALPRGLSREQAAAYVGVSATMFDTLVADGRMPPAKRINSRTVWDIVKVDRAFEALPDGSETNPWDEDVLPDAQVSNAGRQRRR